MAMIKSILGIFRSLSARLLLLTILFVMLAEVLIFVPSVAFYRLNYLDKKAEFAHLAALSVLAAPDNMVSKELKEELLFRVGARSVVFRSPNSKMLMLAEDMPTHVDAVFDLNEMGPVKLIEDALEALLQTKDRIIRVTAPIKDVPTSSLEMVIDEAPLKDAMLEYASNIFWLSLVISLLTAFLVYLSLHWFIVRPMGRLSASMIAFRRNPENVDAGIKASDRLDEIGVAERELNILQARLRFALKQKEHLAALGTAVTKISHDLRNILSTSHIVSDGLSQVDDPRVQKVVPRLVDSINRAIQLCTETLKYGKADERAPDRANFPLRPLVEEVGGMVSNHPDQKVVWKNGIPEDMQVFADREQLYRVLMNLVRNAAEAINGNGEIQVSAIYNGNLIEIRVADNGPGIPDQAKELLFEPFAGSVKSGGTGLGLSIARELMQSHGGDVRLLRSDNSGTIFVINLPC
ncbi:sensor histidine kinase [Sneathiella sp. P13V-1]|uniref:sensor histidine kinase n=1 Tax=Sneathiella sp. P13V-1 TaxID=2697366 RepID=UPI00187B3A49|nr:HAMP domain-containing sensor histidine kinase [Sneathiella sp. P13V-1]MBE7635410.1 sensor histidine kinase [Sneathiella sp. P13V-1]